MTSAHVLNKLRQRAAAVLSEAYRQGQHDAYKDATNRVERLAALNEEGSTFADLHRLCNIEVAILERKRNECQNL